MTLEVFELFGDYSYEQVGYRPQYGHGAQSQPLYIPAVIKHGELISRERCLLPAAETRATAGSRTAFSDMTRSMNAMPQPSLAQTSNLHPDCGGGAGLCQPPRLARSLQVSLPSQPYMADELNTPVVVLNNMIDYPIDGSESTLMDIDSQEMTGFELPLNQEINSQEIFHTLLEPSNNPMMPAIGSQSSLDGGDQPRQKLTLKITPLMSDFVMSTFENCNTGDLIGDNGCFSLLDYCDDGQPPVEPKFDELAFQEVLKPEPESAESDDSSSGGMVIAHDQFAQSPDSTSPVFGRPSASASAHYSNSDDNESEASSFMRPYPVGSSGPSKRGHYDQEEDLQSMASSANELKLFESRRKNNQASKRSRSNKKSRDYYNEHELQQLEDHHNFLVSKTNKLEGIRDQLRLLVTDRVRR